MSAGEIMHTNMISLGRLCSLFLALALYGISAIAEVGDNLVLYPTQLDAIIGFDGTRTKNGVDSRETEWEAGVRLGQIGYFLDPKIAWFLVDIQPIFRRSEFENGSSTQDTDSELISYLFQTNLLRGTPGPFGLDLSAQRSDNFNSGSLGNRYDTVIDTNMASIRWKNPAFPTSLTYQNRHYDEEFRSSLNSDIVERDELLESWILKGRSSKLNVHIEHAELDDRIASRDQDYELDRANLSHNFSWGSNSQLQSNANYYDRNGFNANKRLTLDETARIQHLDNLYSRTSFHHQSTEQTIKSKENGVDFELHHRMHRNLDSIAFISSNKRDSDNIDEDKWRLGFGTQYNKNKLFGATVAAGFRISYQETDRDSNLGLIDTLDESHVVPLNGAVVLDQRFILTATITVTDATGVTVYDEGTDYTILDLSGDLTQLQTVPGGRINTGDTILVSYNAQQLPSQEFSTTFTNYNLSLDYDWFRISHSDSKSNDKLITGASESFLQDSRNTFTELEFKFKPADIDTRIGAERRFISNGGFESTQYAFTQVLTWTSLESKTSRGILWNLNSTQSFTQQEGLDTDLYRVNLSANWRPLPHLTLRPTISYWKRIDEGSAISGNQRNDQFFTAGLWARWRYRKIDLDLNYHHDQREVSRADGSENTDLTEDTLMFTLKRRIM